MLWFNPLVLQPLLSDYNGNLIPAPTLTRINMAVHKAANPMTISLPNANSIIYTTPPNLPWGAYLDYWEGELFNNTLDDNIKKCHPPIRLDTFGSMFKIHIRNDRKRSMQQKPLAITLEHVKAH